jgi:hypothetical protein
MTFKVQKLAIHLIKFSEYHIRLPHFSDVTTAQVPSLQQTYSNHEDENHVNAHAVNDISIKRRL